MAIEAQDPGQELGPEPVHHAHDDDQDGHGQGDADIGDHADQGDPALATP